jgi:hypothetical protein
MDGLSNTNRSMNASTKLGVLIVFMLAPMTPVNGAAVMSAQPPVATNSTEALPELSTSQSVIRQDGVGNGFVSSAQNLAVEAGAARGMNDVVFMLGVSLFFGK